MSVRRIARYLKLTALAALTSFVSIPVHGAGLAPDPAVTKEAVVQVYGARTMGVKGIFGVHTWVAVKPANSMSWTVSVPELYADKRGEGVEELIARIDKAARDYPYSNTYTLWPGPNSNTFTAWIARAVPELQVDLPATAVGKDYIGSTFVSTAPSGTGFQFTLAGVFGVAAGPVDGFELNLLGLNFGANGSFIKLPLVGRVGLPHFSESAKH